MSDRGSLSVLPGGPLCECGFADGDPTSAHYGWHKIWDWNRDIFAEGRTAAQREFDELLESKAPAPEGPPQLDVGDGQSSTFRY